MARPTKLRKIINKPKYDLYTPNCSKKEFVDIVNLKIEEIESMRLKDVENLNQEECAQIMKVSRQTFQLIIDEARRKVALALSQGKAIKIGGGNYTLNICEFKCKSCGHIFESAFEKDRKMCPKCGETNLVCLHPDESFCEGHCAKECKTNK